MNDKQLKSFTALSNDQRSAIFQKICEETHSCFYDSTAAEISADLYSCNVGDISNSFELATTTFSHHLKQLKNTAERKIHLSHSPSGTDRGVEAFF